MKKKKLLLYSGLALLAIIIAVFILLGRYTDRVIDPYVRSLLEVARPMGHTIEYEKIRVNLFQRSIIIREVKMFPDSSFSKEALRIELHVKDIRLTGFSIRKMLFDKTLQIEDLLIQNPEVKLILSDKKYELVSEAKEEKPPKKGSPLLNHLHLEKITFSGGSFQLIRNNVILATSDNIRLIARAISLARNSREEPIGFTYGDVSLNLSDIKLHSETGLYDISVAEFSITKSDSTIVLDRFSMIPKYDRKEFSGKLEFQNDRFDINIGQVKIGHVGIERFLAGEPLEISSIMIDSLEADIYRDKNVPIDINRFPKFYNESFLSIPIPLRIGEVAITNSKITYGELVPEQPVAGSIFLDKFTFHSNDLTNLKMTDSVEHVMRFDVKAMVMGEGPLNAEIILPLEGDLHDFKCSGSVGAMQLKPLNDMLQPSINIKFNGGKVNRMTFSFTANDNVSTGWMEFLYQDLDVTLLKDEPGKKKGFISFLANWVALSNNPAPGKDLKIVEIGYERNKNKGIINYVWKTIQSGMVHTIVPLKKHQINRKQSEKAKGRKNPDT